MNIVVDPDDPTPPYEQLRRQIGDLIGSGRLTAGDRLPPLRQLANDLGLAVGTVARAYRELEGEGLLVSRRGGGTRVAHAAAPFPTASGVRPRMWKMRFRRCATYACAAPLSAVFLVINGSCLDGSGWECLRG